MASTAFSLFLPANTDPGKTQEATKENSEMQLGPPGLTGLATHDLTEGQLSPDF